MMVQLDLITFYVLLIGGSQHIEAQSDKWTDICELDSGDGGMYVSGDVKKIFDDPSDKNNKVVVVENKISDVFVKCVNNKGNAKIYDDNDNVLLENHPEKSSAKLLLWKKNFTTFWNSEKSLKCTITNGCKMTVIEAKDGTHFKSNCTESEGEKGTLWCHIKDWVDNAMVARGSNEMKCNEQDEYDNEAHYKFSFFNQETKKWDNCGEYDQDQKKTHRDEHVSFMKCNISGVALWGKESLLVRMEKIHASKMNAGLSYYGKPDCEESTYFMIENNSNANAEQFLSKGTSVAIAVVSTAIIIILLVCALKVYKGKKLNYEPSRSLAAFTNPDREAGYVEQELIGSTPPSSSNSGKNSTARLSSIEDVEECLPNISYKNTPNFDRQCSIRLAANQKAELDQSTEEEKKEKMSSNILDGDSSKVNPNLPMSQQTRILHYDRRFERCKDSFDIGHIIGEGQYGTVFVGTAKNIYGPDETKVAVKQVKDMLDENQLNTIIDELKILSNLKMHLNLVNLLGACTSELMLNEVYLLLEYCPFGDMKKFLVERRDKFMASLQNRPGHFESPFNSKLLYSWSYSIAKGLEYLASKKIMHGDLAARNILIGENFVAKISDFGLSKMMYYNQDYKKTQRRLIPWAWMATEYLQTGEFNIKSDVWSYGVTLWEIFSLGNKPYGFDPYEETKVKILAGHRLPCPDPLEYIDGGSSVYDDVMMKCWTAEASNRPDFTSISSKLEVLLGEKGVEEYEQQVDQYCQKQMLLHSDKTRPSSPKAKLSDPPGDGYIRVESMAQEQPPVGAYVQMARLNTNQSGGTGYIGLKDIKNT
eukprot:TRINITY_DN6251_c0_g1_i1.p1 TRINITY_DN6251_c0_g1~~TRINITY_DN6251_c0_g1_i1.p1  ORF type:complete len:818 (-),score=206.39 TRINITY_DN6251_c0_g1_i1:417-2870(-)